jgi:hypothetical protein
MGDPRRLRDAASQATPLVRELLENLCDVAPPPDARDEAWKRILEITGATGAPSGAPMVATTTLGGGWRRVSLKSRPLRC